MGYNICESKVVLLLQAKKMHVQSKNFTNLKLLFVSLLLAVTILINFKLTLH